MKKEEIDELKKLWKRADKIVDGTIYDRLHGLDDIQLAELEQEKEKFIVDTQQTISYFLERYGDNNND